MCSRARVTVSTSVCSVCEFYIYIKKESATRMYTKTKKKEIKKPVSQRLCVCACAYVCV